MSEPHPPSTPDRVSSMAAPNDLSALDTIVEWTAAFLAPRADRADLAGRVDLVIEELVVNIIDHGYPAGTTGTIDLCLREDDAGITLVVEDRAPPFDPLGEAQGSSTEASLEDRAIGGLGVHLVRELTDRVSYDRTGDRNRITAHFAAPAGQQGQGRAAAPHMPGAAPEGPALSGKRRLTFRFVLMFVAVFLVGLGCAGILNYLKFERAFLEAAQSRYDPVITETGRTIETSLGPGLTLASSFATTTIIEKVAAQHGGAFNLTVYDTEGRSLFALETPPAHVTYPHERVWPALAAGTVHHFGDREGLGAAAMILQAGKPVGAIVLTHDGEVIARDIARLGAILLRAGLIIAAAATPLLAIAAFLAIWPLENRHLRLAAAIDALSKAPGAAVRREDDAYGLLDGAARVNAGLSGEPAPRAPGASP